MSAVIVLTHTGRTPGHTQFGLHQFTEHYKCRLYDSATQLYSPATADVVLSDDVTICASVPKMGDAHGTYGNMYVTDRRVAETGPSASSLDVVYMGAMVVDGESGTPILPAQRHISGGQVASATTNTSSLIWPATATNPATVQFYSITNTLVFFSVTGTDPGGGTPWPAPDDPPDVSTLITWDLGFGLQPASSIPDLVTWLLTNAFVTAIIEPPPDVDEIVAGQFYQVTKRKTSTLYPYAPAS